MAELLAALGSAAVEVTLAVLSIVPPTVGALTMTMMFGAAPTAREVRVQVTTPAAWPQLQPFAAPQAPPPEAHWKVVPAGSVSVTTT